MLYHGVAGWCEVATIEGDPSHGAHGDFRRWWYRIDDIHDLERLAQQLGDTGQHGLNVYVSSTLYRTRERSKAAALPSRVLFVDDAPREPEQPYTLSYSMLVQTSPASYQAYYVLDERLNHAARERHQAALAAHLHADPSGADVTQIVRVPCGYNTKAKYGDPYAVTLRSSAGTPYTCAAIEAVYPVSVVTIRTHAPLLAVESQLGNIADLLDRAGAPTRINIPTIRTNFITASTSDRDSSTLRYTLAKSLIIHGYPDDEITALLVHFAPAPHKPSDWLYDDITRLISKLRRDYSPRSGIESTRKPGQQRNAPVMLPGDDKPAHRPQTVTPAKLLAWYESQAESSVVQLTVQEVAQQLGVSRSRIERLERALRAENLIRRNRYADNQKSCIQLVERPVRSPLNVPSEVPADATSDGTFPCEIIRTGSAESRDVECTISYRSTHRGPTQGETAPPARGGVCTPLRAEAVPSPFVAAALRAGIVYQHKRTANEVVIAAPVAPQDAPQFPVRTGDLLLDAALAIFDAPRILGVVPAPAVTTRPARSGDDLRACIEQWLESDLAIDYATGQTYKNKTLRLCISHVRYRLGDTHSETTIQNAYKTARDAWQKYRNRVWTMTDTQLQTEYTQQRRLQTKHADDKRFKWYSVKVAIAASEIQRRGLNRTLAA
jgi:hypothetical protein